MPTLPFVFVFMFHQIMFLKSNLDIISNAIFKVSITPAAFPPPKVLRPTSRVNRLCFR